MAELKYRKLELVPGKVEYEVSAFGMVFGFTERYHNLDEIRELYGDKYDFDKTYELYNGWKGVPYKS